MGYGIIHLGDTDLWRFNTDNKHGQNVAFDIALVQSSVIKLAQYLSCKMPPYGTNTNAEATADENM